jgi:carbamoyl-phosphate synthase large subunit
MNIHAVIPGTESEAAILSKHATELSPAVVIANRPELMPFMLDKFSATSKLRELGCDVIPTVPLQDWQQLLDVYGFPIVVKPTRGSGGSRGVHIVTDQQQLQRLLQLVDTSSAPCAQPYVGSSEQEYTVGVLSHFDGTIIDSIIMKRKLIGLSLLEAKQSGEQSIAVSTGYSQGFIVRDAEIRDFCERLALNLDSRGPLNIQLRIDNRTGKPLVFELHPRFSGTTPIRADVGFNEVDLLLRNALFGERFGRINYRSDVAAIRAFEHVIVPVTDLLEQH